MLIYYLCCILAEQYTIKLSKTSQFLGATPDFILIAGPIDTNLKFTVTMHESDPRKKIITSIKFNMAFDTEAETRKVILFDFHGNENQQYELIVKDVNKDIYMIAQGTRCLEWCPSCGYFLMNQCDINNRNMFYEFLKHTVASGRPTESYVVENFQSVNSNNNYCGACEAARQSRCMPCEDARKNRCYSCMSVPPNPPCPCEIKRSNGPYW